MADYYPLIARAIAGLDPSAPGESRRALYERARSALIAQLRGVQPPLSANPKSPANGCRWKRPSARSNPRPPSAPATPRGRAAPRARSASAQRRCLPPRQCPPAGPGLRHRLPHHRPRPPARGRRRRHPSATPVRRSARMTRSAASAICAPSAPARRARSRRKCRCRTRCCRRPANAPARRAAVPTIRRRRCRSRRACAASAISPPTPTISAAPPRTANRNARKTYANVPSPSPEFDRIEPGMENRGADPDTPYSYDESMEEADRYAPSRRRCRSRARGSQDRDREPKKRPALRPCFRSRARSRSASC